MLNCSYRLVAPRTFEPVQMQVDNTKRELLVRPTHLSICVADQRYYRGLRSEEVLDKKLPMALIHEGIGEVVSDGSGTFKRGSKVVMVPNHPQDKDKDIAENYLYSSRFCGSGYDGFMQEFVALTPDLAIELPSDIDENVASFSELVSVGIHAATRFDKIAHKRRDAIGVWGDGNMGFLVSLILKFRYPNSKIFIFGRNELKLQDFTFVDGIYLVHEQEFLPSVDHAFECCGGEGSGAAINQIIDVINPEGSISLLGVSEDKVPINTRMILEKGLRLYGSSRSGREDFIQTMKMYESFPQMIEYMRPLVSAVVDVSSISDMAKAFEVDISKSMGKTILHWNV